MYEVSNDAFNPVFLHTGDSILHLSFINLKVFSETLNKLITLRHLKIGHILCVRLCSKILKLSSNQKLCINLISLIQILILVYIKISLSGVKRPFCNDDVYYAFQVSVSDWHRLYLSNMNLT